jgi:ubiquinone/menaquinone biosynthesis C-methylase UbiE
LWQYLHNDDIAQSYDEDLAGNSLAALDVRFVAERCPPPGRLVDLGCGTGRLLLHLARRGQRVLGVDLSAAMLRVTAEKARTASLAVDLIQANLVDLRCLDDGAFDYAACLFSTLGMVVGADQRRRVVQHVHRILRPGGLFVLHVHNRLFNLWQPKGWQWLLGDFCQSLLGRGTAGDRHMPAHGNMPQLTLHLFTRREALRLLREAGFTIREVGPVSLHPDGKLRWPRCFGGLRTYGYLVAAEKQSATSHASIPRIAR